MRPHTRNSPPDPAQINSGTLADILDSVGHFGGFPSTIRALNQSRARFIGRAYTVRWAPIRKSASIVAPQSSTWEQVRDFLAPACPDGKGLVYVAGTDTGALITELALAGGFSTTDFQLRGFGALVLGGAIRDAHVVQQLELPIWATGFIPADTQGSYRVAETGTWCNVGGQRVTSGDWIFGDETGLINIPSAISETVFSSADSVEATEARLSERIASGDTLFNAVEELGRL